MSALRIAMLAHSTNPRGGVVHALELADALVKLGHEPVVHAPDAKSAGFFRPTLCETVSVPASPVGTDITEMVEIRAADYVRHFENPAHRCFDVFHAQDGYQLRTRDEAVWIPVNLTIARLHLPARTLALITVRDMREQYAAHARLQKTEAELRRVLASVSHGGIPDRALGPAHRLRSRPASFP